MFNITICPHQILKLTLWIPIRKIRRILKIQSKEKGNWVATCISKITFLLLIWRFLNNSKLKDLSDNLSNNLAKRVGNIQELLWVHHFLGKEEATNLWTAVLTQEHHLDNQIILPTSTRIRPNMRVFKTKTIQIVPVTTIIMPKASHMT